MKKLFVMLAIVLCLAMSIQAVSALTVSSTASAGGTRQEVSNPLASGNADQDVTVTTSVTLTNDNTGSSVTPSLGTVTPLISGISASDLNISVTFGSSTIAANGTTSASLNIRVPEDLDAVTSKYEEASFAVADVQFTADDGTTAVTRLSLQRENQLQIDKVKLCANDVCKTLDDNDDFKNLRPGDELEMTITVENRYSDSDKEDIEIQDVQLEFEIDDDDFDEQDDEDLEDINADDKEDATFSFRIDDDVGDGSYDLDIWTYGTDENGALHGHFITIDLEVERKSHDIDIRSATVSPKTLSCDRLEGRISLTVANIGKRDEDDVALEVVQDELGIRERLDELTLDEDDSRSDLILFEVPEDAKPGSYLLSVRSYFLGSSQSDEQLVEIVVPDCDETTNTGTTNTGTGTTNTGTGTTTSDDAEKTALKNQIEVLLNQINDLKNDDQKTTTTSTRTTATPRTSSNSGSSDTAYIIGLVLVVIIVLVVLIFLVSRFLRPKPTH